MNTGTEKKDRDCVVWQRPKPRDICTVLRNKMLLFWGLHLCKACKNSSFCTAGPGIPCTPPQHAGKVRVVEGNHLRAVAPRCGARRGEAQPEVPVHAALDPGGPILQLSERDLLP